EQVPVDGAAGVLVDGPVAPRRRHDRPAGIAVRAGDPERGFAQAGAVALLGEVLVGVDERADPGAPLHEAAPVAGEAGDAAGFRPVAGLEVERDQVAAAQPARRPDRAQEVARLFFGVAFGAGEVVGAADDPVLPHPVPVAGEPAVGPVAALGRLGEGERHAAAGVLGPVDGLLPVGHVDAVQYAIV